MLCHKCGKNEATVRIYYRVNGVMIHKDFCEHCATLSCKVCGTTYDDVLKNGKCGCYYCYEAFYDKLIARIKKIHGSTEHIGKKIDFVQPNNQSENLHELSELLKTLIAEERYEEAALVRDKIKNQEANLL